ncbi:MAG: YceI family protein [Thermoanaerobaculia bacterium]|nr:YceI family protein [Thermoanaerobaculia bacterium]
MKSYLVLLLVCVFSWANAQGNYRSSQFTMTIKGSSNLHDWESTAKEARANGAVSIENGELKAISSLTVEVPVKSIKSPKGNIMDNKTYDALKAKSNPTIIFKLEKINSLVKKGDAYDISATGNLTIAGVTNKIDLQVKGKVNGDATTFSGSKKLKMTDYKIDPPTALFGTMTTGNDIEVVFSVTMKQLYN